MNASEELNLPSATFDDLDAYLGRMWARGEARSTIAGTAAAVRSFFEWGVLTGRLETSPARHLRGPTVYQREAPFLTAGEIDKLIFGGQRGRMPADPFAARDRVLLAVAYVCGLRVSEPGQLRVDNLQYDSGSWSILIERAKAADKDRRLPIGDPVISRMLGHFLEQRSKIATSPWLFPSRPRDGRAKLSDREIHRIFDRAVKSAGIRKKRPPNHLTHPEALHRHLPPRQRLAPQSHPTLDAPPSLLDHRALHPRRRRSTASAMASEKPFDSTPEKRAGRPRVGSSVGVGLGSAGRV